MSQRVHDSFGARRTLTVAGATYDYFALAALAEQGHRGVERLPVTLRILL
jgi:aconitase A